MKGTTLLILVVVTLRAIITTEASVIRATGCKVSINYLNGHLKEPQPLVLIGQKNGTGFLDPIDAQGTLKLSSNESLVLACPGKGNAIQGIPVPANLSQIEATCISGKIFGTGSIRFNFTSVACKFLPKHEARRTTSRCYGNATRVEIGFALRDTFLGTYDICWDNKTMTSHWSKFRLTSMINGFQSSFPRPSVWQADNFYGSYNIGLLYRSKTEAKTIAYLLGSDELARKYINFSRAMFMARGHLTAKADFVYGAAQSSTFWYPNAAPQWQTFNAGNWNSLEDNVRKFAATRTSGLEVYTGVHDQMSLNDINGNRVPIYLYAQGAKRAFPVPLFFWKVVYDRSTKKGTAFVGVNDPWAEDITDEMFLCEDIAGDIKWLTWQANNIIKGISYACAVDDLRKSVPNVPNLDVSGILT